MRLVFELIRNVLMKEPTSLAVCSIGIEDPEENGKMEMANSTLMPGMGLHF